MPPAGGPADLGLSSRPLLNRSAEDRGPALGAPLGNGVAAPGPPPSSALLFLSQLLELPGLRLVPPAGGPTDLGLRSWPWPYRLAGDRGLALGVPLGSGVVVPGPPRSSALLFPPESLKLASLRLVLPASGPADLGLRF